MAKDSACALRCLQFLYSWGMAGRSLDDVSNRVVATGVPMSAVPGVSRFWGADAADGGKILTWENFFLNRDTNTPISAQLELKLSGDNFGPHQTLPEGADTNHYYWVEIVVEQANARVTFVGDGYSHLPDPDFIARAGATNRVVLLLGKAYDICCSMPVLVVAQEDEEIVLGWGERDSQETDIPIATIPTHYHQLFTIDVLGGLRIDKFGQWIKQANDGSVSHSQEIISRGVP